MGVASERQDLDLDAHQRDPFPGVSGSNRYSIASASLILMALMRRKTDQRGNVRAPGFRRLLTIVVAAAYLMVGFAGEVSCAEETLQAAASLDATAGLATTDEGSKKTPTVVDHCYTCAPITIPVAIQISAPISVSIGPDFPNDTIVVIEKRFLDPPPPKTSI
jgi:hypothetical protein